MDNLRQTSERIKEVIDPNGAPQSIKASEHQSFLLQLLERAGKYVGMIYKAKKNLTSFNDGQMSWNDNAFDTSGTFVISFAKKTSDGIDFVEVLSRLNEGDILIIKDFVGRVAMLNFQSFVENSTLSSYEVNVTSSASNITYTYQESEEEICVVSVLSKGVSNNDTQQKITIDGVDYIYKKNSDNGTVQTPNQHDIAEYGVRTITEDGNTVVLMQTLSYVSGTPSNLSSWAVITEVEV